MINKKDKNQARIKRHYRVRKNISGTAERPRLNVFRSLNHIYAQVIDDVNGVTIVAASSVEKGFEGAGYHGDYRVAAYLVRAECRPNFGAGRR